MYEKYIKIWLFFWYCLALHSNGDLATLLGASNRVIPYVHSFISHSIDLIQLSVDSCVVFYECRVCNKYLKY